MRVVFMVVQAIMYTVGWVAERRGPRWLRERKAKHQRSTLDTMTRRDGNINTNSDSCKQCQHKQNQGATASLLTG